MSSDNAADEYRRVPRRKIADTIQSTNYVQAAVKAVKEGKAPEVSSSKPYGCGVKYNKN